MKLKSSARERGWGPASTEKRLRPAPSAESRGARERGWGPASTEKRLRPPPSAESRGARERGWGPASTDKSRLAPARQLAVALICLAVAAGCRQDMHNQPKYRPLRASEFFTNASSARPLVEGTIARGTLQSDTEFFTGKIGNKPVVELPFPVTREVLDRGQERYNIYCTPCHDGSGSGNGVVVQRGYRQPQSFHIDRLRLMDAGYYFDVMTNGFGVMPDYRAQITPRDRWNIVAYIRALQLSQNATKDDIKGVDPTKLAKPGNTEKH